MSNTLYIGIGNPGRSDDGIGWAALDTLREMGFEGTFEYRYQLNVEDAELISRFTNVLLIDASEHDLPEGYQLYPVQQLAEFTFSTHELSPAAVVHLAAAIFDAHPKVHVLEIKGHRWEIGEGLSKKAREHISRAITTEVQGNTIFHR